MGATTRATAAGRQARASLDARAWARRASTRRRSILAAVMVLVAVLWLLPAVWVLVTSLKRPENIIRMPPEWIPWPPTLAHYVEVLFSSSRTARIVGNSDTSTTYKVSLTTSCQPAPAARRAFPTFSKARRVCRSHPWPDAMTR